MDEINEITLSEQAKFRLYEIKNIENYFINETKQNHGVSIISFLSVIGAPAGIASASFTLIFSLLVGIVKKLLDITRTKKKKHNKILMLAKSKFNSIDTLISRALIDMDISHEEFIMK